MVKKYLRCGKTDKRARVSHHVKPRSEGGDEKSNNKICLCANCHLIVHKEIRKHMARPPFYYKKQHKNARIRKLENGMLHIILPTPIKDVLTALLLVGEREDEGLLINGDEIVGFVCRPETLEELVYG